MTKVKHGKIELASGFYCSYYQLLMILSFALVLRYKNLSFTVPRQIKHLRSGFSGAGVAVVAVRCGTSEARTRSVPCGATTTKASLVSGDHARGF